MVTPTQVRRDTGPRAPGAEAPGAGPRGGTSGLSPDRAALEARIGFALGAMAFLALPIAYQWTVRPESRPIGSDSLVQALELGAVLAAAAALFLGRRARAAADRSAGAIWAPRLGAAAIVGYAVFFVLLFARGG